MKRLRDAFITDCCFGMPGIPAGPGACVLDEATDVFKNEQTEAVYQVWKRGVRHHGVTVRDALLKMIESSSSVDHVEAAQILREFQSAGIAAQNPG